MCVVCNWRGILTGLNEKELSMKISHSLPVNLAKVRWFHCALVVAGVLLATVIRFPIKTAIHDASPFVFYFPVVVAVAVLFGWRFGLLATFLSILPADYYWMP